MPQITKPEELFVHELQDMYYAEQTLTKVLPKLASQSTDRELSKAFTSHLAETKEQIENLEQVFQNIGKPAKGERCPGIEGIKEEHESFMQENDPTPALLDMHLTGAAARAEHYEIAAYTGLIEKARALGERDSVKLLQENLRQEKEAAKKVESISKRMLKATNGNSSRKRSTGSSSTRKRTGSTTRKRSSGSTSRTR
ncbi:MAG TPA: ferritin-like domain-containing protein [Gaiellaceae bacterium]|jgi:ferritin-like metal-binding protein YciE|nr:ferritin-like domain-containing protein [Gaiellaceae bacterium]